MEEQFVPYELALKLKELGFEEECLASYNHVGKKLNIGEFVSHGKYSILAPLWQQAIDFFREKYDLVGNVYANASGYLYEIHHSPKRGGSHLVDSGYEGDNDAGSWDDYPNARSALLFWLIKLVE